MIVGISEGARKDLVGKVEQTLKPYYKLSSVDINSRFGSPYNPEGKSFCANLIRRILRRHEDNLLESLETAEIELKTIRIDETGRPSQNVSLPAFEYVDLVKERWETSAFRQRLLKPFLFTIFRLDRSGTERFERVFYWTMPERDREGVCKRVWEDTVAAVRAGRFSELPKESESRIAHVRPHGRDREDKVLTSRGSMEGRKSFWLNAQYIAEQIPD